jgi:hypothetical protein
MRRRHRLHHDDRRRQAHLLAQALAELGAGPSEIVPGTGYEKEIGLQVGDGLHGLLRAGNDAGLVALALQPSNQGTARPGAGHPERDVAAGPLDGLVALDQSVVPGGPLLERHHRGIVAELTEARGDDLPFLEEHVRRGLLAGEEDEDISAGQGNGLQDAIDIARRNDTHQCHGPTGLPGRRSGRP